MLFGRLQRAWFGEVTGGFLVKKKCCWWNRVGVVISLYKYAGFEIYRYKGYSGVRGGKIRMYLQKSNYYFKNTKYGVLVLMYVLPYYFKP